MNKEFAVHILNEPGKVKAALIADVFDECLEKLLKIVAGDVTRANEAGRGVVLREEGDGEQVGKYGVVRMCLLIGLLIGFVVILVGAVFNVCSIFPKRLRKRTEREAKKP